MDAGLTPQQMERLGWNLFFLLGFRLGTIGVRWVVATEVFSPRVITLAVLLLLAIAIYLYGAIAPNPVEALRSKEARFLAGSSLAGLVFGFF